MFVSRGTHRATRKNWSDLRSNEGGSEKNSARNSISPVIPTANRFHFLPAQPCCRRAHPASPPPIDRSIARARDETKTRRVENAKCFALIILPLVRASRNEMGNLLFPTIVSIPFFFFFFLPINLINTFIDDPFFRSYKITPLLIRSKKYSIDDNRESIISFT